MILVCKSTDFHTSILDTNLKPVKFQTRISKFLNFNHKTREKCLQHARTYPFCLKRPLHYISGCHNDNNSICQKFPKIFGNNNNWTNENAKTMSNFPASEWRWWYTRIWSIYRETHPPKSRRTSSQLDTNGNWIVSGIEQWLFQNAIQIYFLTYTYTTNAYPYSEGNHSQYLITKLYWTGYRKQKPGLFSILYLINYSRL